MKTILTRQSLVEPQPKKRPKSSYVRFAAEQPNQTWQSDFTHYRLLGGIDTEVLTWLDDHSRYALHGSAPAWPRPRVPEQQVRCQARVVTSPARRLWAIRTTHLTCKHVDTTRA